MKVKMVLLILLLLPYASAAHWIVGYINDAADTTSPNGRTVKLLHTSTLDEAFGIVGPTGMSGTSNVYMVDCELMDTPCTVGDTINITLVDDGTSHNSKFPVQVTVTGAGFDIASNMSMTTPFLIENVTVDDSIDTPANEIDLTPNATTSINCGGVVETFSHIDSVDTIEAVFYASSSTVDSLDDNNYHYTNSSCSLNKSYGTSNQGQFNCTFDVEYYANSENWNCFVNATDNLSTSTSGTDESFINPLLSIWVNSTINFTTVDQTSVSDEKVIQVINLGNVAINLSLSGYGQTPGDGLAMVCTAQNITIENAKYNVTFSNSSSMDLSETESQYTNLSSVPIVEGYGLNFRQNDISNDAKNNTYWRVYVPRGPRETCQGNIIIGATLT